MFPSGVKTAAFLLGLSTTAGMLRVAAAHDGDPLSAFGAQGRAQFNFTTSPLLPINYATYNESLYSPVAVQADGKVVLAATAKDLSNDFGVLRLNADGSRDTSFGPTHDGQTIVPFDRGGGNADEPNGIALDEHGNILVSGSTEGNSSDGGFDCAIVRLTPDGSLDSTFSTDGKATIGFDLGPAGQRNDHCMRVAVQRDGKILVVAFAQDGVTPEPGSTTPTYKAVVARLTSSGARDTSFNGNGIVIVDFGAAYPFCFATGIVQQSDGGIVIVGSATDADFNHSFAMARLHADGTFDNAFGSNGIRVFRPNFNGYDFGALDDVVSLSDGSFVVNGYVVPAGTYNYDYYFARVRSDGSLDPAFGSNGSTVVPIDLGGPYEDYSFGMALDSRGRIVANGVSTQDSGTAMVLVRLTPNGQLDPAFGNGGVQVTSSTPTGDIMFGEVGGGVAIGAGDVVIAASLATVDTSADLEVGVVELVGDTIFSSGFSP
jgi:uncharacterized delta-60 repeat protein